MYSRSVSNLLLAGRDISTTHVAHGTTRVMKTCAVIGEAAGNAAALSLRRGQTPRELASDECRVKELQQTLLRDGMYLPLHRNDDPFDLAQRRDVTITATSDAALRLGDEMKWEEAGLSVVGHKGLGQAVEHAQLHWTPLNRMLGQAFVMSGDRVRAVSVHLRSTLDQPVLAHMQVRQARHLRDFGPLGPGAETLSFMETMVPPGASTVMFPSDETLICQPDHPLVVVLEPAEGLSWATSAHEPPGTQAGMWDEELGYWRWIHGSLMFDADPISRPYRPTNIISGVTRPERGANMWISDPSQSLPQSIKLSWTEPVDIGRVEVTFDSQLSGWTWEGPFPTVVREYVIEASKAGMLTVVAGVTDNHERRRIHDIHAPLTEELTLTVRKTNGAATARVVEIRVYPFES
jgi:hypothetical protein